MAKHGCHSKIKDRGQRHSKMNEQLLRDLHSSAAWARFPNWEKTSDIPPSTSSAAFLGMKRVRMGDWNHGYQFIYILAIFQLSLNSEELMLQLSVKKAHHVWADNTVKPRSTDTCLIRTTIYNFFFLSRQLESSYIFS